MGSLTCDKCGASEWSVENGYRKCKYCGALFSLSNDEYDNQSNFEKINERFSSEEKEICRTAFGWKKIKTFKYVNGDVRITFVRNKRDSAYDVWVKNEQFWEIVQKLYICLLKLSSAVRDLKATYAEIESEPEYKLTGLRGFFHLRKSEQIEEISNKVREINAGYDEFRRILQLDLNYVRHLYDGGFLREVLMSPQTEYPRKDIVLSTIYKYNIKIINNGDLSMDITGITYSFKDHSVKLS